MIRLVDFVDQEHTSVLFLKRFEKRTRLHEFLGKEDVSELVQTIHRFGESFRSLQDFVQCLLQHLCVQQLFSVLPLVDRLRFVQTFHSTEVE